MITRKIFHTTSLLVLTFVIGIKCYEESRHKRKNNIGHAFSEPNYIFLLPENKTVILRKSDFDHVIYPNVTNVNKFGKNKKLTNNKNKDSAISESASKEKFEKFYENIKNDDEDYERIVKENIQTERNFVNFIEEMNLDLSSEEVKVNNNDNEKIKIHLKDKIDAKNNNNNNKKRLNGGGWDDLGLEGWEGALTEKRKNITNK